MTPKVLIADNLSAECIEVLRRGEIDVDDRAGISPDDLLGIIGEYDGLIIRSRTKVTPELLADGKRLRVIGRAGIGVDNIDLEAATKAGVVVMNTPGGSSVTVAEHVFATLLALARHIPRADASMKLGKWEKTRFQGSQLCGKTLGVVGLGSIGSMVVRRALAFGMSALVHDPFINADVATGLGAKMASLEEMWAQCDVVSLHVPLNDKTHHLINEATIAKMKPGAYLINCSRGGVVDEVAAAEALRSGKLAGAAFDVFEKEPIDPENPLLRLENVVCTPHLGASTREAQDAVAVQLGRQFLAFFKSGEMQHSVNVPPVSRELIERLGPWLTLATKVGSMAGQMAPENPASITVEFSGDITKNELGPLSRQVLTGLLTHFTLEPVNTVNAVSFATSRGLSVAQVTAEVHADYVSTVGVSIEGEGGTVEVVGTVFGRRDLRIVRIDGFEIDARPKGHLLEIRNDDVPKIVGRIGTILGDAGINIARIHLSRDADTGQAFSMVGIDSEPLEAVLDQLRGIPQVNAVRSISL
jgi:D-3-phosphoglycerate dehydrogenase/(S)-sulfolactate dehydrogenase